MRTFTQHAVTGVDQSDWLPRRVISMARIDRPGTRLISALVLALALTTAGAEARGFRVGTFGPRVGAWGRPLGPVRPSIAPGDFARPGFVDRSSFVYRPWRRRYWEYGYGLGGFGLGLGLGGLFGPYSYPGYYDDDVYAPPVYVATVEVPVVTEVVTDESAAVAACARRFKTYDPQRRTYIGKGYVRRRCP